MYSMVNHLVIMAGGVGSRFWPMSTPDMPKQFIDVLGVGKSLLQLTVERFSSVVPAENVWIVTSGKYHDIVREQIPQIADSHILMEPCMRNTAPCIAYVSYKIQKQCPDANIVFSPADHIVLDVNHFREVVGESLRYTEQHDAIVTLGMQPTRPETGYGYIKGDTEKASIRKVLAFKEKPNLETAQAYLADGTYFWNAGIFIWNVNTVISEFEKYEPELAERFSRLQEVFFTGREQEVIDAEFPQCKNISIDYAIMERSRKTMVYPASFGWSDLGTWGSLYTHLNLDKDANAIVGQQVTMVDCKNCVVHTPSERKVVLQGLDGFIVAESKNTLLVCRKSEEQHIKEWQN